MKPRVVRLRAFRAAHLLLPGACAFFALATLSVHAADPVVVWSRDLRTTVPVSPASATILEDESLLVSLSPGGVRRVRPGGRVEVLSPATSAGFETDAEGRVFRGGSLARIDPATGLVLWDGKGGRLAFEDGASVFGRSCQSPNAACLVRLDAQDGRIVWQAPLEPGYYTVDSSARSGKIGVVAWHFSFPGSERVLRVVAFDLETGETKWTRNEASRSEPLLLGSGRDGTLYQLDTDFGRTDILRRIDPRTGEDVWRRELQRPPREIWPPASQLLVDGYGAANVLWGDTGRTTLSRFDAEGHLQFDVFVGSLAAPLVRGTEGNLLAVVSSVDGLVLERRDGLSGRLLTRTPLGPLRERFLALGSGAGGHVAVHTTDTGAGDPQIGEVVSRYVSTTGIVALEVRANLGRASSQPGGGYAAARIERGPSGFALLGSGVSAFNEEDGTLRFTVPGGTADARMTPQGDFILGRGYERDSVLEKRDGRTGEVVWTSAPGTLADPNAVWVITGAGDVVLLRGRGSRLTFERLRASDGTSAVKTEIVVTVDSPDTVSLWAVASGILVRNRSRLALVDEATGVVRWIIEAPHQNGVLPVPDPRVPRGDLLLSWGGNLARLNASTGETEWSRRIPYGAIVPLPEGDVLVLGSEDLTRISRTDGAPLASGTFAIAEERPCISWRASLADDGRLWAACTYFKTVAVFDSVSCEILGVRKIEVPSLSAMWGIGAGARDAFIYGPPFLLRVSEGPGIAPVPMPSFTCGEEVDFLLPFSGAAGSRIQLTAGALPAGLRLQEWTGRITGRLTTDGAYAFGAYVQGAEGTRSATSSFTMFVRPSLQNPLELEADPPRVVAGQQVRVRVGGADLGAAASWLPGGERATEILVRPQTSTRYTAAYALPGVCPRRGSLWVEVEERATGPAGSGYFTVVPCRLIDTRERDERLVDGELRLVEVAGRCGIPPGVKALSVNVTAIDATRFGTLVVVDTEDGLGRGTGVPFAAGRSRGLGLSAPVSGVGFLGFRSDLPSGGTTHAIVDVSGYFF